VGESAHTHNTNQIGYSNNKKINVLKRMEQEHKNVHKYKKRASDSRKRGLFDKQ
jgi:hypothetical protein